MSQNVVSLPCDLQKSTAATLAPYVVRGRLVNAGEGRHLSRDLGVDFLTPKIDLDALITLRTEPGPLFDVTLDDILDFLAASGEAMKRDKSGYLAECIDKIAVTNVLPRSQIEYNVLIAAEFLN